MKKSESEFWSWVVGRGSWVVGRGSWVVGRGSWVVGRGSWVVGRGSWVVGRGSWLLYCVLEQDALSSLSLLSISLHPSRRKTGYQRIFREA